MAIDMVCVHEDLLEFLNDLDNARRNLNKAEQELQHAKNRVINKAKDILQAWHDLSERNEPVPLVSDEPGYDTWRLVCQAIAYLVL